MLWWHAGKFYSWVSTLLPFLPQQFDENDDSELSESQMYVAEGQRVVNRALPRVGAGEMTAVLLNNLAHYVPSQNIPTGGALVPLVLHSTAANPLHVHQLGITLWSFQVSAGVPSWRYSGFGGFSGRAQQAPEIAMLHRWAVLGGGGDVHGAPLHKSKRWLCLEFYQCAGGRTAGSMM